MTEDHARFVDTINEARERLEKAHGLLYSAHVSIFDIEAAALQLRTAIELIVYSSLASHRQRVEQIASAFAKKGAGEAFNLAERVNPEFWPQPIRFQEQPPSGRFPGSKDFAAETVDLVVLTQEDAWKTAGELSRRFLHAHNPYGPVNVATVDIGEAGTYVIEVWSKLDRLLHSFYVKQPDTDTWLLYESLPESGLLRYATVRPGEES